MFGKKKPKGNSVERIHRAFDLAIEDINRNARLDEQEKEFARNGVRLDYRNALKQAYSSLF